MCPSGVWQAIQPWGGFEGGGGGGHYVGDNSFRLRYLKVGVRRRLRRCRPCDCGATVEVEGVQQRVAAACAVFRFWFERAYSMSCSELPKKKYYLQCTYLLVCFFAPDQQY
jgi:hypothetical protein